jgi:hypothetical protein
VSSETISVRLGVATTVKLIEYTNTGSSILSLQKSSSTAKLIEYTNSGTSVSSILCTTAASRFSYTITVPTAASETIIVNQHISSATALRCEITIPGVETVTAYVHYPPLDRLLSDICDPTLITTPITAYLHHAILFDPAFFDPVFFDTVARYKSGATGTFQPNEVPSYVGAAHSSGMQVDVRGDMVVICSTIGAAGATSLTTNAMQASPPTITDTYFSHWDSCYNLMNLEFSAPDCYSGYYIQPFINGVAYGVERWVIQTATTWNTLVPAAVNACYFYKIRTAHVYGTKYVTSPYACSSKLVHAFATITAHMGVAGASGIQTDIVANVGASVSAIIHSAASIHVESSVYPSSPPTITSFTIQSAGGLHTRLELVQPLPEATSIEVQRSTNGVWESSSPYLKQQL